MRKISGWALGLTLLQIGLVLWVNGGIYGLRSWDASWYMTIAEKGIQVPTPLTLPMTPGTVSTVAFFPAFPIWVRAVHSLVPLDFRLVVNLAAQLAAFGAWVYFFLLLREFWKGRFLERRALSVAYLFLILPGAFYLVVGYSESLFLFGILGFLYWCGRAFAAERVSGWSILLAILHGGIMGSTRVLGVALLGYPFLLIGAEWIGTKRAPRLGRFGAALVAAIGGAWGFLAFLAYCRFRWGSWTLYWEANRAGWNVYFDPWKLLSWSYYRDVFFVGNISEVLGRGLTVATLVLFLCLLVQSWKTRVSEPARLALSVLLFGFLLETIIGSHGMHSMIRYLIPIHAPLIVLWATRVPIGPSSGIGTASGIGDFSRGECGSSLEALLFKLLPLWLALFAIQVVFIQRYSAGGWVS